MTKSDLATQRRRHVPAMQRQPQPRITVLPKERPGSMVPVEETFALETARHLKPHYQEMLHLLGQRQYLDTGQLARLFFRGMGNGIYRVLRVLKEARMVWCWRRPKSVDGLGSSPFTWFLDWNGMYAFKELWPDEPLRWDSRYMGATPRIISHTVQTAEVWVRALEVACDPGNRLGAVGWLDEWNVAYRLGMREEREAKWFRPDGMLTLCLAPDDTGHKRAYQAVRHFSREMTRGADGVSAPCYSLDVPEGWLRRSCWIEVDMGTQSMVAHKEKMQVYTTALINAPMWNRRYGSFGPVLIITTTVERAKAIAGAWKPFDLRPEDRSDLRMIERKRPVGVATWHDYATQGILGQIWWTSYRSDPLDLFALVGVEQ